MAKRPPFVKLDVNLPSNEKLLSVSVKGRYLYTVGILAAGRDLTDGHVRPQMIAAEAGVDVKVSGELVGANLWHDASHGCPRCPTPKTGHVYIHDYLEHQQSRAEVEERSAKMAAGGRRGATSRWGTP